ncbi:hypothetical protein D3C81_2112090 [compost metagenome]
MGQGATQEQRRFGGGDVHGVTDLAVQQKGFAHMVEQHEQNHQAPQGIDGQQPASAGGSDNSICHGGFATQRVE